jgi:hypothetical protein
VAETQPTHTPKQVSPSNEGSFARSGAAAGFLHAANDSVALLAILQQ